MRAVRGREGAPVLVEVDEPPGHAGEVITMRAAGICASDLGYLAAGTTRVLGHELAGVRADGTPVMVEGMFGCGECAYCRAGRNNLCAMSTQRALGILQDGGMVERYQVPGHKLIPLPRGLDVGSASLAEPASVSWHGARMGGAGPGTRVVVIGGGSVGQLAAAAATAQGAQHVALVARHPHQHAARERLGFAEPDGDLYDVVIEAAGSASALQNAVDLVRPGGKIAVLGVHYGGLDVPYTSMLRKEVTLVASLGYSSFEGRREMQQAAEMLAARPEIAATLITHRFPMEDAAEAFRVAADRTVGGIKVVLDIGPA